MTPLIRAKLLFTAILAIGSLVQAAPALAQYSTRDSVRIIEQEYARSNAGRTIPDSQLEYYLDRMDAGWSMDRVRADIAASGTSWRPAQGWTAREVICSSINSRYSECRVPFRGQAVITQQISSSPCVEGRTWGNKPGAVWVRDGCRARFGIVRDRVVNNRVIPCHSNRGRYRECATGMRGQVRLLSQTPNSNSCVEGRTWGQKPGIVWVRANCRASFAAEGRRGPRDDAGPWTRRPNYAVTCASIGGGRQVCSWDDRYGTPRLIQQISRDDTCVEGTDWGYTRGGGIWVTDGCRATFGYGDDYEPYRNYGYRDWRDNATTTTWVRDPNYGVTCSSVDGQRTMCTWDTRYGNPYLIQQMSSSQCIEGRDWGYDRNGNIWVSSGCRARFGYR